MTENRKHPRKEVHPPVALRIGEGPRVDAYCNDASLGGMFLKTSAVAPYGAAVTVHVTFPALKEEMTIEATVRWTKPGGMGLQFGNMGAKETYALTELLGKAG